MKTKGLALWKKSFRMVPAAFLSPTGDTWENSYHELLTVFLQSWRPSESQVDLPFASSGTL
jgi:hypothetical protein